MKTPTVDDLSKAISSAKDTSELRNYFNNPDFSFKYFYQIFVQQPNNLPLQTYFIDPEFNSTNDTAFVVIRTDTPNKIENYTKITLVKKDGNFLIDYPFIIHFEKKDFKIMELPIEFVVVDTTDTKITCRAKNVFLGKKSAGVTVFFELPKETLNEFNKNANDSNKGIFEIDLKDSRNEYGDGPISIYSSYIEIFNAKLKKIGW
ncbi:MAG: hypothetical protein LCH52_09810 [Bacteroidetes bacterium]|nr:hypothetical protein [Bacteroidota bacterium]